MLTAIYPESADEIRQITAEMKRQSMGLMDIQYRIKNPVFLDPKEDWEYFAKKVLPWMFQYATKYKRSKHSTPPWRTSCGSSRITTR